MAPDEKEKETTGTPVAAPTKVRPRAVRSSAPKLIRRKKPRYVRLKNMRPQKMTTSVMTEAGPLEAVDVPPSGRSRLVREDMLTKHVHGLVAKGVLRIVRS